MLSHMGGHSTPRPSFTSALTLLSWCVVVCSTNPGTTLDRQLSDSISQQAALLITNGTKSGNLVSLLSAHNISLVIGEGNSNSEPGELGVCDVFAGSALWAIDTFFELARVGLRRFHVHSHEADLRSPIFFENPPEPHTLPWVQQHSHHCLHSTEHQQTQSLYYRGRGC